MAVTTKTQVADAQTEFFNARLLMRARPYQSFDKIGLERPVPMNSSTQVRFRRYGNLAITTTNLSEPTAESPDRAAVQLSTTDVTGTIIKRGNGVALTDQVLDTSAEDVKIEATDIIAQNAGESIDVYYRNVVDAGTSVIYGNDASRAAVNTAIDGDDIRRAVRTLENNNARKVTSIINATTGIGTVPIRPCFIAICHPFTAHTLRQLSGWRHASEYASQVGIEGLMDGEIGQLDGIRFVMTTQARAYADAGGSPPSGILSTGGTQADVYETLVFGMDSYGRCPLKGAGLQNIMKELGSAGTADFLNEMSTVAWKFRGVCVILNDNFQTRIEHAVAS